MYATERQFVSTAHSQLRLLEQGEHHSHQIFEDAISQIKTAAGPVKARAIYRAALLCEDVLKRCDNAANIKFQASLKCLKNLVELYASGLYEIDPSFLVVETTADMPEASVEPPLNQLDDQLKADNENAANLLKPLLHLVKDTKQTDALLFIAGIDQQLETTAISPHQTSRSSVRFDNLMRRITNNVLGEARAQAKNVSISYAADFDTIDTNISSKLEDFLQEACTEIVRSGLVINGDLAASLNRNWQISITGETQGANLSISLNWQGQQLLNFGASGKVKQVLQNLAGKLTANTLNQKQGKPDIHVFELTCPAHKSTNSDLLQMDTQPQARQA